MNISLVSSCNWILVDRASDAADALSTRMLQMLCPQGCCRCSIHKDPITIGSLWIEIIRVRCCREERNYLGAQTAIKSILRPKPAGPPHHSNDAAQSPLVTLPGPSCGGDHALLDRGILPRHLIP
jgi:hypothetical protein